MSICPPRPMLATLGSPPHYSAGFAVEAKYDGQRGLAVVSGGAVTLWSHSGANITHTFPEISAALPQAGGTAGDPRRRDRGPRQGRRTIIRTAAAPVATEPPTGCPASPRDTGSVLCVRHPCRRRPFAHASAVCGTARLVDRDGRGPAYRDGEDPAVLDRRATAACARRVGGAGTGRHRVQAAGFAVSAGPPVGALDQDTATAAQPIRHRRVAARHRRQSPKRGSTPRRGPPRRWTATVLRGRGRRNQRRAAPTPRHSPPRPTGGIAFSDAQGRTRGRRNGCAQVFLQLRRSPTSPFGPLGASREVGEPPPNLLGRQDAPDRNTRDARTLTLPPLRVLWGRGGMRMVTVMTMPFRPRFHAVGIGSWRDDPPALSAHASPQARGDSAPNASAIRPSKDRWIRQISATALLLNAEPPQEALLPDTG